MTGPMTSLKMLGWFCTGLFRGEGDVSRVVGAHVVGAVAVRTVDFVLAHRAGKEIRDDVGRDLPMAFHTRTLFGSGRRRCHSQNEIRGHGHAEHH